MNMQVFIKPVVGNMVALEAAPQDTVGQLKERIEQKMGVEVGQQRLVFAGVEIRDEQTLEMNHIIDQSLIHLVSIVTGTMQIKVELQNQKQITLDADPSDTISILKMRVASATCPDIPLVEHALFYDEKLLDDAATVDACKIPCNAVLKFAEDSIMNISMVTPLDRVILITLNKCKLAQSLRDLLCSAWISHFGVTPNMAEIRVFCEGREMDCSKMISDQDMKDGSTLHLYTKGFMVTTIKSKKAAPFHIRTQPDDIAEDLVARIFEKTGSVVNLKTWCFEYKGIVLHSTQPLSMYGIHDRTEINLVIKPPINTIIIKPDGERMEFKMKPSAPISTLKKLIEYQNQEVEDIPEDYSAVILKYNNMKLEDDFSLPHYGIINGSEIQMSFPIRIAISVESGKKYAVSIDPDEPITTVKSSLVNLFGIPAEDQILFDKNNKELLNENTLNSSEIKDGDLLTLVAGISLTVSMSGYGTYNLTLKPSDTIKDVKQKLALLTRVPIKQQQLSDPGRMKIYSNAQTLQQCEDIISSRQIRAEKFISVPVVPHYENQAKAWLRMQRIASAQPDCAALVGFKGQ